MEYINIAVDGHSASGKSTICDLLAKKLNINHLSSGGIYRAIALYFLQNKIDYNKYVSNDEENLKKVEKELKNCKIDIKFDNFIQKIFLNDKDVTDELNTDEISNVSSIISQNLYVREFVKNIQINLGLVKRRIKSSTLKTESRTIGRKTLTNISILYFEDIADANLVNNLLKKIDTIDIDGIVDSSSLGFLLGDEENSVYPTFIETERPDNVATFLMEGKIAIVVDTSPFVLIIPAFFIDFVNPVIDNYNKSKNVNFIKILRISAFLISMMAPAIYIAIMNYNQETIPTNLLLNFAIQRGGVPFPTIIETLLMLFVCEILRESDLRFPLSYGSAISILGAIVLGEASVSAGIASPITIIVIAITFISSLTFTTIEINNALRFFRFVFILLSGLFGLYGITLGLFYFLIYTTTTNSFGKPYFAPISPFNKEYFNNTVLKKTLRKDTRRSTLFTHKNIVKQKEDLWKKY